MSLLVEKLVGSMKKLKQTNPDVDLEMDEDVKLIFFSEFDG